MSTIEKVIQPYGLHPYKIEQVSERVYKVSDGHNVYALKESRLTENTVSAWERVFHHAYGCHLSSILPVYLTNQSSFYVKREDSLFYLTPWTPDHQPSVEQAIINAFETIGDIHAKTKQSLSIDTETVAKNFNDYRKRCTDLQYKLLSYVAFFEQNRFMSPFELQVCTHYHVLVNVLKELDDSVGHFINELKNEQKWHYSLCHGDLKLTHFIHNRHTYVIDWEKATYDTAVLDLSMLLHRQASYYEQSSTQLTELLSAYSRINALTSSEHHLLTVYLLHPFHYISLIDNYTKKTTQQTMITQTRMLESAFRQLEIGLKWSEIARSDNKINAEFFNEYES